MDAVDSIRRLLQSTKVKDKREGLKQLDLQLDSPLFLHRLDSATAKLWPQDKLAYATWPGLLDMFLGFLSREALDAGKHLDSTGLKVLRRIFTEADNTDRCGPGSKNLLRRAGVAFDKIHKVLESAQLPGEGFSTPLGQEFAMILQKVLLPNADYCQRSSVAVFQGLLEEVMCRFEGLQQTITNSQAEAAARSAAATAAGRLSGSAAGFGRGKEVLQAEAHMHTMASLLSGLLGSIPGQLASPFVVDVASFLVDSLMWLGEQRRFGRLDVQLLSSLNGLMLVYGAELRPSMVTLHKCMHDYIKQAWGERHAKLKDCLLCYCRLALTLGGLTSKMQTEMMVLVSKDINAEAFVWDLQGSKQQQQLVALTATLYYHQAFTPAAAAGSSRHGTAARSAVTETAAAAAAAGLGNGSQGSCGGSAHTPAAAAAGVGSVRSRSSSVTSDGQEAGCHHVEAPHAATATAVAGEPDVEGDIEMLPRKRSRVLGPAEQLLQYTAVQPERWCPVLAVLLHLHGPLLPSAFAAAALKQLSSSISLLANSLSLLSSGAATTAAAPPVLIRQPVSPAAGAALATAAPGPPDVLAFGGTTAAAAAGARGAVTGTGTHQQQQQQLVCLLRCTSELALCWPAELHRLVEFTAESSIENTILDSNSRSSFRNAAGATGADVGGIISGSSGKLLGGNGSTAAASDAVAARESCSALWQQIWNVLVDLVTSSGSQLLSNFTAAAIDAIAWQLHAAAALKLVDIQPSRAAALHKLLPLLLALQEQQQQPLSDAQLALVVTLCCQKQLSSHSEVSTQQRLLQACLATAEMHCSSSSKRSAAPHRPSSTGTTGGTGTTTAAGPAAATAGVSGAAACLPELLLPAILALLEAPGPPTPGLNGFTAAQGFGRVPGVNSNGGLGISSHTAQSMLEPQFGGCGFDSMVWYHCSSWWWSDRRVETLFEGLRLGLETLKRRKAALKLQQVLAASAVADENTAGSTAAVLQGSGSTSSAVQGQDSGGVEGSSGLTLWWKCWCQLADGFAESLTQAIVSLLPDEADDDEQQHPWAEAAAGATAGAGAGGTAAQGHMSASAKQADPNRHLSHVLLLANVAAHLPCIAATKCMQVPQLVLQQQQQGGSGWCGVSFSGLAGLHVLLLQQMLDAVKHAGQLLREHLSELPCTEGSTWLLQLQHLGASLARLQRIMNTFPASTPPAGAEQQQVAGIPQSRDVAIAVAAGVFQPVILQLEQVVKLAAAAAVAEPDDPRYKKSRTAITGDLDLEDDFAAGPPAGGFTQGGFGFTPSQATMGPPASRASTAAAAGGSSAAVPGYAVLVTGGLAGFSGGASGALGPATLTPALAAFEQSNSHTSAASGFRHGFASGGLGEGLLGVTGAEGAGLRVLAALSPACGADAAQGLLQLWMTVSGTAGGAPSEVLLEAIVETVCIAVCSGGWLKLSQLFGLIQGSHTLLAAQKPPLSTLHLLLRLLQTVAVSAVSAGVQLDCVRGAFLDAVSQGTAAGPLDSQDTMDVDDQGSMLDEIMEVFKDVHGRLAKLRKAGEHAVDHNLLPQATQLQLGLTILALLQLHPQHAYGSTIRTATADGNTSAAAEEIEQYRLQLLELLDMSSYAVRVRAGPLAAQLIADSAAAAAAAAAAATEATAVASSSTAAQKQPAAAPSGDTAGRSVSAAVLAAVAAIQQHLTLQQSSSLDQQQTELLRLMQKHPANMSPEDEAHRKEGVRQMKALQLCWDSTAVQLADLAAVTAAVAAAAIQQEEAPNALDVHLLQVLCTHAAFVQLLPSEVLPGLHLHDLDSKAAAVQLACTTLDIIAVQQQYSSRYSYLAYHSRAWLWHWFATGHTFGQLLLLHPVLSPPPADSSSWPSLASANSVATTGHGLSSKAAAQQLLDQFGSSLLISILLTNADQELQAMAEITACSQDALLDRWRWDVYATLYPFMLSKTLKLHGTSVAEKVGQKATAGVPEKLAVTNVIFSMALPVMLRPSSAQQEQQIRTKQINRWCEQAQNMEAASVFYPLPVALEGYKGFCKNLSNAKECSWLERAKLSGQGLQKVLLNMHKNIAAAAHPIHKLQRLGQLEALLHLLHQCEATAPAVARYYVSMLLQLVHTPALQPSCCYFLELLYRLLYAAAADSAAPPATAGKGASREEKAAVKAAQQKQQQDQQLAVALLEELLPPTVANLVQCVERAAAQHHMQQQQLIWNNSSTAPPAGFPAAAAAAIDLPASQPAVAALLAILRNPPDALLQVIQALDLLPPLPVLAEPVALQQRLQQGLELPQRIVQFVDRASGMAASSRHRSVHAINVRLKHSTAELYEQQPGQAVVKPDFSTDAGTLSTARLSHTVAAGSTGAKKAVKPAVVAAASRLANLGAQLGDTQATQLAGHLLALAGPLDPNMITFDIATAAAAAESGSKCGGNNSGSDADARCNLEQRTAFPMHAVLQQLVDCLFHQQPHVVAVAQKTLSRLLATTEAAAVVHSLQQAGHGKTASNGSASSSTAGASRAQLLASYLSVFAVAPEFSQSASQFEVDHEAAVRALNAAASPAIWSTQGKCHDKWLCSLCSVLLTACGTTGGTDGATAGSTAGGLLQLLADAAALQPQLAELLLPHALLLLCESDGSGADVPGIACMGLAASLGACISEGLCLGTCSKLRSNNSSGGGGDSMFIMADCNSGSSRTVEQGACADSGVDMRSLGVLLSCLEHNRLVQRAALLAIPGNAEPPAAVNWQRCYCLHINYLDVAAAAMACKAYFTALIYIEHWCEEQYGKLTLNPAADSEASAGVQLQQLQQLQQLAGITNSNSSSADHYDASTTGQQLWRQQQELLEQMLLDLYRNVNDPDGIYAAAAAFSSAASQLQLLQHEQQWASVLGAEDALLQRCAIQHQAASTGSAGVLMALQHYGCHSTAQQCLASSGAAVAAAAAAAAPGRTTSNAQQQQQLLGMQCELAWRLSDWGIADSMLPAGHQAGAAETLDRTSGSGGTAVIAAAAAAKAAADGTHHVSFNAAVLTALQALQLKDVESFRATVSSAQHDCVVRLARSSTQSAAAVNPPLVQLQMLHLLQQGLEVARAAAAAAVADNEHRRRSSSRSHSVTPAISHAAGVNDMDAEQLLQQLLGADYLPGGGSLAAEQLRFVHFQLSDQLLALQAAVSKVLRRPDMLAFTLQAHAHTARKAGQVNFALSSLQQLQQLLQQACTACTARSGGDWTVQAAQPAAAAGGTAGSGQANLPTWLCRMIAPDAGWLLESIKLKWQQGQQLPAFRELQALVTVLRTQQQQQQGNEVADASLSSALIRAQTLAGQWMAAGQFSSNSDDALGMFKAAAAIAQQQQQQGSSGAAAVAADLSRLHCRVYFELASYADLRFKELEAQMASPEWQKQLQVLESKKITYADIIAELQALQRLPPSQRGTQAVQLHAKQLNGRGTTIKRQYATDEAIVQQLVAQRDAYLRTALSNYKDCIVAGNTHDLQGVYRLCSIWFKHWSDTGVNGALADVFASAPSAKFVPLVYQIASRLGSSETQFQAVLKTAITKLTREHPYHSLYSLIALNNGNIGMEGGRQIESDVGKVQAAAALLQSLKAGSPSSLAHIIDDMASQVEVFMDITNMHVPRDARGKVAATSHPLDGKLRRRMLALKNAPPICSTLPLDPSCKYEDVPHVVEVDSHVEFVGGINAPMVLRTTDSTGHTQKQLVKSGNDDMRQDAVMQQFFGLINALLSSSAATARRQLSLRTYRVVPCSPKVGVVQWVEGTLPMLDYLAPGQRREGGAHARYRKPGNLSWFNCYMKLSQSKPEELKDKFLYCTAHFPPVFHNFFLERFAQPANWFTARTAYTRSTAVNSMAGAIIGLGDRHLNNVLLDLSTAEVLHIDLGIAFEQGLFLNTPERVPFRLTANVVDGMGAAGIEGTFRRCCETTLQMLRDHKEALLTVVEVVLHDPLYKWQMTPVKARRKQQDPLAAAGQADGTAAAAGGDSSSATDGSGNVTSGNMSNSLKNADAERAVLRVKQKLEGQDVEGGAALSVAAQVGKWVQEAQDADRLCRMFVGWAAWV